MPGVVNKGDGLYTIKPQKGQELELKITATLPAITVSPQQVKNSTFETYLITSLTEYKIINIHDSTFTIFEKFKSTIPINNSLLWQIKWIKPIKHL